MMGRREDGQGQFFYAFDLDKVVPLDHLVRQIDGVLDLALLWQILLMLLSDADPSSAVRASLKRPNYEVDDGVAHGWQAWLRRWSVDSFFSASLLRDGDAGGRRKRSLS